MLVLPIGSVLVLLVGTAHAATYTLHHRIGSSSWSKRGVIQTTPGTSVSHDIASHYTDLTGEHAAPWRALPHYETWSEELYQLALTPDGKETVDETLSPMTFARVCHLAADASERFTLHTDSAGNDVVGLSYDLLGLEEANLDVKGCPTPQSLASASPSKAAAKLVHVQINKPQKPLSPLPPAPPPMKQDGTPLAPGEEPPKEQSFFRKYWYYILPVVALMVIPTEIADSNNEESEGGGDGSLVGGAPKAGRGAPAGGGAGNVRRR